MRDLKKIKKFVEVSYGICDLEKKTRKRLYTEARAVYFKIAKETTDLSLDNIGFYVNRNHATVLHGINKIYDIHLHYDPFVSEIYNDYLITLGKGKELKEMIKNQETEKYIEKLETKILIAELNLKKQKKINEQRYDNFKSLFVKFSKLNAINKRESIEQINNILTVKLKLQKNDKRR